MVKGRPRVIVIGLDGATFKNLKPWMEKGLLPNLKSLVDNGVSGELESTMPRLSSPAWVSFMTGVNPGKHGIFGFFKPFKDKRYKKDLTTSKDIKCKTIFELLSEYGKTSGVVNLPMTYPPFKINGFMVGCGLTTPGTDFDFTHPKDLFERFGLNRANYILNVSAADYPSDEKEKFYLDLIKEAEQKKEISFRLMGSYDWDLFILIFGGTDRLQHHYWHCIDPEHPRHNPAEAQKFLPLIIQYYQKLDSIIGDFINYIDDNTSLLIMSDHGFGPFEKKVSLDNILERSGFLYFKNETLFHKISKFLYEIRGILHQYFFIYRRIKVIIKSTGYFLRNKFFKRTVSEAKIKKRFGRRPGDYWQKIDWKRTFAYSGFTDNSVCLNLKGREPEGIVNTDGEYLKIRNRVIGAIADLYDHSKRKRLNVIAYKKEEIYTGPYVHDAPDLFFEIEDGKYIFRTVENETGIFEDPVTTKGWHTKYGILICYGNNFKKKHTIKDARIIDLVPTILYLLQGKIPEYMDGKVLEDVFKDEFIRLNPVAFENIQQERDTASIQQEAYSEEEMERVKKHLADLGYL